MWPKLQLKSQKNIMIQQRFPFCQKLSTSHTVLKSIQENRKTYRTSRNQGLKCTTNPININDTNFSTNTISTSTCLLHKFNKRISSEAQWHIDHILWRVQQQKEKLLLEDKGIPFFWLDDVSVKHMIFRTCFVPLKIKYQTCSLISAG